LKYKIPNYKYIQLALLTLSLYDVQYELSEVREVTGQKEMVEGLQLGKVKIVKHMYIDKNLFFFLSSHHYIYIYNNIGVCVCVLDWMEILAGGSGL
jgi:hypothetical protein